MLLIRGLTEYALRVAGVERILRRSHGVRNWHFEVGSEPLAIIRR